MARKCASAWARTLAKPAGFVMRAARPASELAQRLHSSNSTAWSSMLLHFCYPHLCRFFNGHYLGISFPFRMLFITGANRNQFYAVALYSESRGGPKWLVGLQS